MSALCGIYSPLNKRYASRELLAKRLRIKPPPNELPAFGCDGGRNWELQGGMEGTSEERQRTGSGSYQGERVTTVIPMNEEA
jgi:hypothetical protein